MRIKARTYETLGELMHYLSQYDFKIIYSLGKHNIEAVALSRNPVLESSENEEEVLNVANIIKKQDIMRNQKENKEYMKNPKDLIIKTVRDFFRFVRSNHILNRSHPFIISKIWTE